MIRSLATLVIAVCTASPVAFADGEAPSEGPSTWPAEVVPTCDLAGMVSVESGLTLTAPDLTRVAVYLQDDPRLPAPSTAPASVSVAQKNKTFVPNFTVVPVGTNIEFPNFDDFDHNVFSLSKAAPAFDLDRYPKGKSKSRVFSKVGIVQVFCNIHPKMRAIIVVTPNAFFARPDKSGHFVIRGVPAGHYKLAAWQERCGEQQIDVDVDPAHPPTGVTIQLRANRRSVFASEAPPDSGGYGVERGLGVKREHLDVPVVEGVHDAPRPSK